MMMVMLKKKTKSHKLLLATLGLYYKQHLWLKVFSMVYVSSFIIFDYNFFCFATTFYWFFFSLLVMEILLYLFASLFSFSMEFCILLIFLKFVMKKWIFYYVEFCYWFFCFCFASFHKYYVTCWFELVILFFLVTTFFGERYWGF